MSGLKILIATHPAAGHVNPVLPIARELVERGHDVRWYTGRDFRHAVETVGARFQPMVAAHDPHHGHPLDRFPQRPGLSGMAGIIFDIKHLFIDEMPVQVDDLRAILADFPADVLVADPGLTGAAPLRETGGPPLATVSITPLAMPSRDLSPFGLGLPPLQGTWDRIRASALRRAGGLAMRTVEQHHATVRHRAGLPPTEKDFLLSTFSRELVLQSGTPAIDYPRSDLPAYVHHVGPLLAHSRASGPAGPMVDWHALAAGRPIVLVTQGTFATDQPRLVGPALTGLADEDVLVVAVSASGDAGVPVPANGVVERYAPYDEVMPHVAAMVTNGGYGGVMSALAHGVPLVVAGTTEDKPEVAARVAWTGAGINLKTSAPTPERIRHAVRRVLGESRYLRAAQAIRDDFASHDAPREAADLVEQLARTRKPVTRPAVTAA